MSSVFYVFHYDRAICTVTQGKNIAKSLFSSDTSSDSGVTIYTFADASGNVTTGTPASTAGTFTRVYKATGRDYDDTADVDSFYFDYGTGYVHGPTSLPSIKWRTAKEGSGSEVNFTALAADTTVFAPVKLTTDTFTFSMPADVTLTKETLGTEYTASIPVTFTNSKTGYKVFVAATDRIGVTKVGGHAFDAAAKKILAADNVLAMASGSKSFSLASCNNRPI